MYQYMQICTEKYYYKLYVLNLLKVVSDLISECPFCENFLGGMPPDPLEGLYFALCRHQDSSPLSCGHAISEMANQIWF